MSNLALQDLLGGVEDEIKRAEERLRQNVLGLDVAFPSRRRRLPRGSKARAPSVQGGETAVLAEGWAISPSGGSTEWGLGLGGCTNGPVSSNLSSPCQEENNGAVRSARVPYDNETARNAEGCAWEASGSVDMPGEGTRRSSRSVVDELLEDGAKNNQSGGSRKDRDDLDSRLLREQREHLLGEASLPSPGRGAVGSGTYMNEGGDGSQGSQRTLEGEGEGEGEGELFFASDLLGDIKGDHWLEGSGKDWANYLFSGDGKGNGNSKGNSNGDSGRRLDLHDLAGGIWDGGVMDGVGRVGDREGGHRAMGGDIATALERGPVDRTGGTGGTGGTGAVSRGGVLPGGKGMIAGGGRKNRRSSEHDHGDGRRRLGAGEGLKSAGVAERSSSPSRARLAG
ncbi:unnamed protein product, partial [Discosporangium mesarthrocarpum]